MVERVIRSENDPLVSVIISVYNAELYIGEAVKSILAQTFKDFEIIIVDDGSTDKTVKILKSFTDPRIQVYHQENMGLTKALNKAIRLSRGKYIARLDADEISVRSRIGKQVAFLDAHPEVGMVGNSCRNIRVFDGMVEDYIFPTNDDEIRSGLIKRNMFNHGSVMIRKQVFDTVGMYNESFSYVQDYELWGRVAKKFKLHNLPEILLIRKVTPASLSQRPEIRRKRAFLHIKAQLSTIKNLNPSIFAYSKLINKNLLCYFYYVLLDLVKLIRLWLGHEIRSRRK